MPGKHSAAKLALRRERAISRGFLIPKAPSAKRILVAEPVADRVKAVARSLELQASHQALSGTSSSFARSSTRDAKPFLSDEAYRSSMQLHDRANIAKHFWSSSSGELHVSLPLSGASAGATISSSPLSGDIAVRHEVCHDVGCQTEVQSGLLLHGACEAGFADQDWCGPLLAPSSPLCQCSCDFSPLVAAQNSTIALLTSRLDQMFPSHRRLRELENGLVTIKSQIESLPTSLSKTVDEQMYARSPIFADKVKQAVLEHCRSAPSPAPDSAHHRSECVHRLHHRRDQGLF